MSSPMDYWDRLDILLFYTDACIAEFPRFVWEEEESRLETYIHTEAATVHALWGQYNIDYFQPPLYIRKTWRNGPQLSRTMV